MKAALVSVVVMVTLVGCGGASDDGSVGDGPESPGASIAAGIDPDSLLSEIEILASDEFGGRAPGSAGEALTIDYLTEQFSRLGLVPGSPDGTWVQAVPLVGITPKAGDTFQVTKDGESQELQPGTDYVAWTKHVVDQVEIDAEFVFVGYGAVAPEYEWDDYGDIDVEGKILLFLVNDPPRDDVFGGQAMTYYGRWTYKHEIAAAKGAAGSFVIHETEPAGYPWEVIGSSPYGESFDLVAADNNEGRAPIEGWMQRAVTARLFEMSGLDFEELKVRAADGSFEPVPLGVYGRAQVRNTLRTIDSQNFVAKLEGAGAPDEVVMYVAHWDHLGQD